MTVKFDADLVESVLQELTSLGLQCDERYARMLIRSRIARGQGPLRIEQEMKSKGLASVLINRVVQEVEVDWFELARGTRERRFGHNPPMDMKLKSKQYRFLQYRGFSAEQIQYAMNPEK